MESRTKNTVRNIIFGTINKVVTIILPFIMRTVMIYVLGTEYLGLNSLFTSILQVLNLTELGFGTALVYSMYKPLAENDDRKVCQLLNYYKQCYRIIGIIVLIIGIIIIPFLNNFIAGDYPAGINIYYIYIIYLINTTLSYFLYAYKGALLIANQRNDINSNINTVLSIVQNIFQIMIILLLKNYYYYIAILPIITIANNLVTAKIVNKKYPKYNTKSEELDNKDKNEIKKNVKGMIFQKIGNMVLNNVDNIVISSFLGLSMLGIYNNYYYIITALFGVLDAVMNAIKASVGNSIILEPKTKNYEDFTRINFLYVWIISWMSICLLCLMQNFMKIWMQDNFLLDNYMIILFVIYFFTHKWCDMLFVYQEAKGLWWENRYVPLIAAIFNLVFNIILVKIIGLPGILISTIVSILFIYDIGYAKVLFKEYFNSKGELLNYIIKQIKYLLITLISGGITFFITNQLNSDIWSFILKGIIALIVPNIIFLMIYYNSKEFKSVMKFIKNKLPKKRGENI